MIVALGFAIVVTVAVSLDRPVEVAAANAATPEPKPATEPLVRSDPGIDPWVERDIPPPKPKVLVESQAAPKPTPDPQTASAPKPVKHPDAPSGSRPDRRNQTKSTGEDYPRPTGKQSHPANHLRLPPGAIMSLTIPAIGLRNAPVLDSVTKAALNKGVVHLPDTSLPWSKTPERNVYLAGHRLGWPGTGSHLVFYRLDELTGGERITLRDRQGKRYHYRVLESFTVQPDENWVTGRVRGRDLLTLQTCTPIPTFQKRLIVRAERS